MGGERSGAVNAILTDDLFKKIADEHKCSTGVVSLSWAVQRGVSIIPKSSSNSRISDNIKLVMLTEDEIETINGAHDSITKYRIADTLDVLHVEMDGKRTMMGWSRVDFGWEDERGNWLT